MIDEVLLGSAVFVAIVLVLVGLVLSARIILMPNRAVMVEINGQRRLAARTGDRLLAVLSNGGLSIPSACGGAGTCGQCRVRIGDGCPPALPTETALLPRREIRSGTRLACQTVLRGDISVDLPPALLDAKRLNCTVISSRTVAPLIREIVLALPEGSDFRFTPGAFVMVEAPPHQRAFSDFVLSPEHQEAWDRMGLAALRAASDRPQSRAYSIANRASDGPERIVLLVRLALPPPDRPDAPPGAVSSWLFGLATGDELAVSGPFGSFAAQESRREMIFIGGGVGMAPLRAILSDLLDRRGSERRISFWYGARSRVDLFYEPEFEALASAHPNFSWTAALSDPASEDNWTGETGFIHEVALRKHLSDHPAPHDCEYYLCGPPLMIRAVLVVLHDLGVPENRIFNDDFGD